MDHTAAGRMWVHCTAGCSPYLNSADLGMTTGTPGWKRPVRPRLELRQRVEHKTDHVHSDGHAQIP